MFGVPGGLVAWVRAKLGSRGAGYARRARAWVGKGRYHLGGGADGDSPTPLDARGESECSRFVFWAWRKKKRLPRGVTMGGYSEANTTAMVADALGAQNVVELVPVGDDVLPGDAVVYPGVDTDGDGDRDGIGHTGVVVQVPKGWQYTGPASLGHLRVVHCNAGPAPAIDETGGQPWARRSDSIVVRPRAD
jgi:cell wall-associated NlpC family hydrolase